MDHETTFTVLIQGEKFTLSQSQVQFDSPNYFSTCFLGDFCEAQTRSVELTRNPEMFPLIQQYLCGYMVLPPSESASPKGMTFTQIIVNLRVDAIFYQLKGLIQQCDVYLEPLKRGLPAAYRYYLVGWKVSKYKPAGVPNNHTKDTLKRLRDPKCFGWHLDITKQELDKLVLKRMFTREDMIAEGADGIRALTTMKCCADRILPPGASERRRWILDVFIDDYSEHEFNEGEGANEEYEESEGEDDGGTEDANSEQGDSGDGSRPARKFQGYNGEMIVVVLEE
ncbi:unnamed protein product [Rhizoctonia solani]|uniref:BTB domain-containing protein n=1 Tax=Rhizoctonia solani TaxID=456999 RepID=A0A8H2WZG7_9AGAM|nr:unnamed protein product [Rhizoctonia solani]